MTRIDVWTLDLAYGGGPEDERVLSEDERARAARLVTAELRRHFTAARVGLRRTLGAALACDPGALVFRVLEHGKPVLDPPALSFNLSHSGSVAMVAVTRGAEVGIDVERVRTDVRCEELARRFFSAEDRAELERAAPGDRAGAFFRMWTRREAVLKARGTGMTSGMQLSPAEASRWHVVDLCAPPGHLAALAVNRPDPRIVQAGSADRR